jgi:hypothetical protein
MLSISILPDYLQRTQPALIIAVCYPPLLPDIHKKLSISFPDLYSIKLASRLIPQQQQSDGGDITILNYANIVFYKKNVRI